MLNNWIKPTEAKPKDGQKIEFKVNNEKLKSNFSHSEKKGLYIESEDMFFVGFENESDDFYFSWYVLCWRPLV
jgi:hypothetical protein